MRMIYAVKLCETISTHAKIWEKIKILKLLKFYDIIVMWDK